MVHRSDHSFFYLYPSLWFIRMGKLQTVTARLLLRCWWSEVPHLCWERKCISLFLPPFSHGVHLSLQYMRAKRLLADDVTTVFASMQKKENQLKNLNAPLRIKKLVPDWLLPWWDDLVELRLTNLPSCFCCVTVNRKQHGNGRPKEWLTVKTDSVNIEGWILICGHNGSLQPCGKTSGKEKLSLSLCEWGLTKDLLVHYPF